MFLWRLFAKIYAWIRAAVSNLKSRPWETFAYTLNPLDMQLNRRYRHQVFKLRPCARCLPPSRVPCTTELRTHRMLWIVVYPNRKLDWPEVVEWRESSDTGCNNNNSSSRRTVKGVVCRCVRSFFWESWRQRGLMPPVVDSVMNSKKGRLRVGPSVRSDISN